MESCSSFSDWGETVRGFVVVVLKVVLVVVLAVGALISVVKPNV